MDIRDIEELEKYRNVSIKLELTLRDFYNLTVAMGGYLRSDAETIHKVIIDDLWDRFNEQLSDCQEYQEFLEIVFNKP